MKSTLQPGLTHTHTFTVSEDKLVPALYPEADEFAEMPTVFATGFLVGLIEWTCIKALAPYLDWPAEQSVGTGVDIRHLAATPTGFTITSRVELVEVDGKRLVFEVSADDGVDRVCTGRHERFVIDRETFDRRVEKKKKASAQSAQRR